MSTKKQIEAAKAARECAATMNAEQAASAVDAAAAKLEGEDVDSFAVLSMLIRKHGKDVAFNYASSYDTYLREAIPMSVWVWLGGDLIHG